MKRPKRNPRLPVAISDAILELSPEALRQKAEARLRKQPVGQRAETGGPRSEADANRLLHELQVHQIELEMQNAELQEARDRTEVLLDKYTDLYDFAPVGYFSLNEQGRIVELNLTGAGLLGQERSQLLNREMHRFVVPSFQPVFSTFLARLFSGAGKEACEISMVNGGTGGLWASIHGVLMNSVPGPAMLCRVAMSDITALRNAETAKRLVETLAIENQELQQEIQRREVVEKALKQSEQQSRQLLESSQQMQEQLRQLSRQVLSAQEDERKRISRDLHDVIAQTLAGISIRLTHLRKSTSGDPAKRERDIARTQELVQRSVDVVHQFARELRPTVLDDLGLIPALHTFMKDFKKRSGIHVRLSAFAAVEEVKGDERTVLFRVGQEALTNIQRHSQASAAEISIKKVDGAVCMRITDNGNGFIPGSLSVLSKNRRLGLLGMKERLEMVGGTFEIASVPGEGTTVTVRIPLAPPVRPRKRPASPS